MYPHDYFNYKEIPDNPKVDPPEWAGCLIILVLIGIIMSFIIF